MSKHLVRTARAADERAWRAMWRQYNGLHGIELAEDVTSHVWRRMLQPDSQLFCLVAELDDELVGFVNYVLHDATWITTPCCYLEDLFVAGPFRRRRIARGLIDHLVQAGVDHGWSRLYWHAARDNPARRLYDQFIPADEFVRYRLTLPHNRAG